MGFIGYASWRETSEDRIVRVYLECEENGAGVAKGSVSYTYEMDFVFPGGKAPCRLRGVESVLALKKFYKLAFSLEERAREHGNDRHKVFESVEGLLEHLGYTRNARDLSSVQLRRRQASAAEEDVECTKSGDE